MRKATLRKSFQLALSITVIGLSGCGPMDVSDDAPPTAITQLKQKLVVTSYDPLAAALYARINYSDRSGPAPFPNFDASGGNCVNFVSQCILAGLTGSASPPAVYARRYDFDIDSRRTSSGKWYFHSAGAQGKAWVSTSALYNYAKTNPADQPGLHFMPVTESTISPAKPLDVSLVQIGDVVFADWGADGRLDHTMIVTNLVGITSVDDILVSSQNNYFVDQPLGRVGSYRAAYKIYRPLSYSTP